MILSALPLRLLIAVWTFLFATALSSFSALAPDPSAAPTADQIAFFEKSIRPVLVDKCYKCHSADATKVKGGLLLDTREGIRVGGDSGHAVVPGDLKESLLVKALHWQDKDLRMPPEKDGGKLPDNVVADFEKWIQMGAPDPREGEAKVVKKELDVTKAKQQWAYQAPKAAPLPAVQDAAWPRTDVDRFLLAAQEAKGLHPVADAGRGALLRRVYFDLIGLPPMPQQIEAFMQDKSPDALAKIVDVLLASPQFGERWGRHWLDVARFAESTGKERNFTYPAAWHYRDYVIAAFNADKPYDEFIREQIAGDLLPARDSVERAEHLTATGFLALGPKSLNEKNREQFRMDMIDEQIDATSRAVLGLTVACARCHDHKFDPVLQKDYYALAGIFRSTETLFGTDTAGGKNRNASKLLALPDASLAPAAPASATITPASNPALNEVLAKNPKRAKKFAALTADQKTQAIQRFQGKKGKRGMAAASANVTPVSAQPAEIMAVQEARPMDCHLLVRGEIAQPGDAVPRGFITVLSDGVTPAIPPQSSGRLELAQWLASPANPLTARVAVNRVWMHLFGQGLVRTADNFGATGEKPSNPELLDTLAAQFMSEGWSVKRLIRSLVLSRAYQLSSAPNDQAYEIDPDNRLLWRASPRRLDAESIRDAMLTASGQIELAPLHGSVVANVGDGYIGKGIEPERFSNVTAHYRSVYLPIVRDFVPEALDIFDFAEPSLVVATRDVTNVPVQALYLLNNGFVREQAAAMAKRIIATPLAHPERIALAYELALSRPPTEAERTRAEKYLLDEGWGLVPVKDGKVEDAALLSWSTFCQALFACAEFRYLK
jgi:cytochrome c553